MDPRARTLVTICYVVAVGIVPTSAWWRLAMLALLLAGVLPALRLPARYLLLRLLPLAGLGAGAALAGWLGGSPGPAAQMTVRLLLVSGAAMALTMSTSPTALIAVLAEARMPGVMVTLLLLTARYVHVLEDEARRAARAWQARSVSPFRARHAVALGRVGASLVRRSVERADRIALAMVARGFSGTLPCAPLSRPSAIQALVGIMTGAALIAFGAWR